MIVSYLLTGLRKLRRQVLYSVINVMGLAAGVACFVLIALFVHDETTFDQHWQKSDRIHRITREYAASAGTGELRFDGMPAPAAPALQQQFPEMEVVARMMCCGVNGQLDNGDLFSEPGYMDADNALFQIFDFTWVSGDPATALTEPLDLVLTASAARKYFGDADPMGKTLMLQLGPPSQREPRVVKGVIEDLPRNTHLQFEMLGSMSTWLAVEETAQPFADWNFNAFQTYTLLREGADADAVTARADTFFAGQSGETQGRVSSFSLTPIADIHLDAPRDNVFNNQMFRSGSMTTVYSFAAIGVFILLLACINFVNLATAGAAQRGREVGVRKVLGASRQSIRGQFFLESILLVLAAVALSQVLVELALPYVNAFLEKQLSLDYLGSPLVLLALVLLVVVISVLSAGYPAFYLSGFQAARVLRGDLGRGIGGVVLRRMLVLLQFSVTIVLLIATAVIHLQMRFARNLDTGFDMEQVVLSGMNVQPQRWDALRNEWLAHPGVESVTKSSPTPFFQTFGPAPADVRVAGEEGVPRRMGFMMVDDDFFETYRVGLVAGQSLASSRGDRPVLTDDGRRTTSFVINEMAARLLGWTPEEAVGKSLDLSLLQENPEWAWAGDASGAIVGVARDVYWRSVHNPLEPLVYRMYEPGHAGVASIRLSGEDIPGTLAWIDQKWKELGPPFPIARSFLQQDFAALYRSEQRQGQLLAAFSALAIVISCMGLFGLASFMAEQRTREIGVRKVMGGSVWQIVLLLTNDFSKLVLIANVIAWPVAYVAMQRWLENFALHIDLTPFVFIGCGLIALCVAWVTVGGTAAKAASQKPVLALRYE